MILYNTTGIAHLKVTSLCCVTFQKSIVSFIPQRKPEIMQRARVWETCLVSWVSLIFSIWPFKFQLSYCQEAHFSGLSFRSSEMWYCIIGLFVFTISFQRIAGPSSFKGAAVQGSGTAGPFKIKAPWSFQMSGTTHLVTECHIQEDFILPPHRCKNLRYDSLQIKCPFQHMCILCASFHTSLKLKFFK
jgi:hypothetical protein